MSYGREDAYRERIAELQTEMRRLQFQNSILLSGLREIAEHETRGNAGIWAREAIERAGAPL